MTLDDIDHGQAVEFNTNKKTDRKQPQCCTGQYLPGIYKEENPLGPVSEERDLLQSIK